MARLPGAAVSDGSTSADRRMTLHRRELEWRRRALGLLCRVRELRQMWRTADRTVGRQYRALQRVVADCTYHDEARDAWAARAMQEACRADWQNEMDARHRLILADARHHEEVERESLRRQLAESQEVLRLVEWSGSDEEAQEMFCPVCGSGEDSGVHTVDCRLAAALGRRGMTG